MALDRKIAMQRYANTYANKLRQLVFNTLGFECKRCGISGPPGFLDVDHKKGGGAAEKSRRTSVWILAGRVVRDSGPVKARKIYQLLCPNCHRIKTLKEKRKGNAWNVAKWNK